ncbi:hypothetical protein JTB14_019436 [Gonioctena quinquepunctata]|nr:hypothetical protein JTB14_019436 [Gonioctena quinquepunctata]
MKLQAVVKAFLLFVPAISAYVFPDDFHKCNLFASDINDCYIEGIKVALEILGSEEGVTSPINMTIEPMLYKEMKFIHNNSLVQASYNLSNCKLYEFSKSTVNSVNVNAEELILELSINTSVIGLIGDYSILGEVILNNSTTFSPLYGSGTAAHISSGVVSNHTIQGKVVTIDDVEYLKIVSYNVSLAANHHSIELTNLYNGEDPKAAALAQEVVDANTAALHLEVVDVWNAYFADIFSSYAEKLVGSVPKKDIFVN